jgi:glycerol-1-phosphate dehydrogenase [NAD(P)+]
VEHYISHVLDMRGVEFDAPVDFHGIQCAVGTRYAVALYEKLKGVKPDKEKALSYARSFSYDAWKEELRKFLGKSAESMIALEEKEKKYDAVLHEKRLDAVLKNWDQILQIMEEELPTEMEISDLLDSISAPKMLTELGIPEEQFAMVFKSTKDIRDKYVLSRLLWDLGILEELLEK